MKVDFSYNNRCKNNEILELIYKPYFLDVYCFNKWVLKYLLIGNQTSQKFFDYKIKVETDSF